MAGAGGDGLFTPDHDELRAQVRAFVASEITPHVDAWEQQQSFPKELFVRAGDLGYLGLKYPESVGGSGPDLLADAVATEELAVCGSGGVAAALGAHKDLAALYVYNFGTPEQHERWLVPAVAGRSIGAFAVTEPDAGSDVAGIKTSARRDGSGWVLNGSKTFITNGAWADFVVVAAKSDPAPGHQGLTLFVVEADAPGFSSTRIETLGWRTSQTGELSFVDVTVPDANRLGDEGAGWRAIMTNFAWERMAMALAQAASAAKLLELAMDYARQRNAFGRSVASFQVWRHRFADLATEVEATRALTYRALRDVVRGGDAVRLVAMAKLHSSEVAVRAADTCLQVHGGYGYAMASHAQRAWRDARLGPIGGGTSEVMREIISRTLEQP